MPLCWLCYMKHVKILFGHLGLADVTITGLSELYIVELKLRNLLTDSRGVK